SGGIYGTTANGAETLAHVITHIFGRFGLALLALIFTLACLTTSIGLITSISQYFSTITKLSYKTWTRIFTLWSLAIANLGLNQILKISVPILNLIYPIALVLIILSLFNRFFKSNHTIYFNTVLVTGVLSLVHVLDSLKFYTPKFINQLPLYKPGLAWALPALIVMLVSKLWVMKQK
ncbi:MAG TPA: branched-chain amino acid transport system II carrier protein, partial [Erysipelothrix sp.]